MAKKGDSSQPPEEQLLYFNGVNGATGAGELAGLNYLGDPALFMGA